MSPGTDEGNSAESSIEDDSSDPELGDPELVEYEFEDDFDFTEEELAERRRQAKKKAGRGTTMLGAAMFAVGEIFEPTKNDVEIVQTDDAPPDEDDPLAGIAFGDLPPLD